MSTTNDRPTSKKIVVIGGVAGGMSVAARARRLDESAEIVVLDRGEDVSFSNCALPFHLSGIIPDARSLVLMTPECFATQYNIDARVVTRSSRSTGPRRPSRW